MARSVAPGFTLIELLIVVAIVGILAAIAYPSYQEQIRKSRRTDATSSLLNAAQTLERCYTETNAYDDAACVVPTSSTDGHYTIAASTPTATTYTLTATPVTGDPQADDSKCKVFSLTHTGVRTATGDLGNDCWPQ